MKSLRERDGLIVNHWYVACLSHELKDKPIERIIYDQPLVLFRNERHEAICFPDRCLHRHTKFSMGGKVVNGRLVCPYHGWRFNSEGQVDLIPSEGPDSGKKYNHCMKKYPCVEQDGAIWVWMGDEKPDHELPPWRFPFAEDKNWIHYFMITDFDNEVTNLAENFMDVPHTVFVHAGWFRDLKNQMVPMTVETEESKVLVTYHQKEDKLSWVARTLLNPKKAPMKHTDQYIYPNITRVDYWFGDNGFIINSQITPVSTLKSRVYTYIAYKVEFAATLIEPIVRFYTRKVINQDVEIMRNQGLSLKHDPVCTFRSTPVDEVHVSIERLRNWGEKGNPLLKTFKNERTVDFWI